MANITRIDPFDDLFRGFFVRPVEFDGAPVQPPSIKMDVKDRGDNYLVHAELPGVAKEVYDSQQDCNRFSWKDMGWNAAGAYLGVRTGNWVLGPTGVSYRQAF